jgi:phosphate transport system permease protein
VRDVTEPTRTRRSRLEGPQRNRTLSAYGEPMLWLTGGGLAASLLMIVGLLLLVVWNGLSTFWPTPLVEMHLADGNVLLGEVTRDDSFRPQAGFLSSLAAEPRQRAERALANSGGEMARELLRTGNYELTGEHFKWVSEFEVARRSTPEWAMVVERMSWGRFYGFPIAFKIDDTLVAQTPAEVWAQYNLYRDDVAARVDTVGDLEEHELGAVNRQLENARLQLRGISQSHASGDVVQEQVQAQAQANFDRIEAAAGIDFDRIRAEVEALNARNAQFVMVFRTADGTEKGVAMADIVRVVPANHLSAPQKFAVYASRWGEFLSAAPREANSEGGVWPAIFGTVFMTLIMSALVTPFGVLAALYLREYARQGFIVSAVRIAVNNLAGVPSIVFGVFGLGFFSYIVGASIDELFFSSKLPSPTFGTGGVLWASLTLALLTLPVVIVATEEALAAVPSSMREGSYACGASKWQTIRRIVLPRALPGIMTGVILAIARGAGEVAPLMLVGAVKLAPELPVDGIFPFIHMERSFMHLGFHIYDLGFQSQNSEAAKPMVFTTTLLLVGIVASLNFCAVWLRARLRRRFVTSQF